MSRAFAESSTEYYYCRPMKPTEEMWDTGTCASTVFTDKGFFSPTRISHYPPRGDLVREAGKDSPSVEEYAEMNPFDTISQATPPGDMPFRFTWLAPPGFPAGDYTLRVEVSKEFDFNVSYDESLYPTTQCNYFDYGLPYRGQPSVVYDVPFTFAATDTSASIDAYTGYSDLDGVLHAPDATITTDTPGSGGSRLRIALAPDSSMYRVRVETRIEHDAIAPDPVGSATVTKVDAMSAEVTFIAPGDDGDQGVVSGYEIRYRAGETLDEATFASATPLPALEPKPPGTRQRIALASLSPFTHYAVGIRAFDNCGHDGPLVVATFETPTVEVGCGCRSGNPAGLAIALLALRLRRRRRR
jgi:MYXO-CTERM domain-containing protein